MCLDKIKHFEIYVDSRVKEAILNIITKFKNMISSKDMGAEEPAQNNVADDITNITSEPVEENNSFSEPEPVVRRVIRVLEVVDDIFPPVDENKVLIKAQPSATSDQCLFMLNRPLFSGHSWWFPTFEAAEGSPLAERLFSLEDVESVLVNEATVTITRKDKNICDWKPLGAEIGTALRELLEERGELISQKIISEMPSQDEIQEGIQKAINEEVNPGVAGHGGLITLEHIKGNTITIKMGGGCQGCSAADLTLKQGVHSSFRKFVPQVGAIFDETDHAAGLNPYF
jgi:Fe-S cluster biogenesis protein NfuA